MTNGINHLLATRIHAGVAPTNKYAFSRTTDLPIEGCTAMRQDTSFCPGLTKKVPSNVNTGRKFYYFFFLLNFKLYMERLKHCDINCKITVLYSEFK